MDEPVPKMVWFTSAATHDHALLKKLSPDDNTIYVFDKGYNDYKASSCSVRREPASSPASRTTPFTRWNKSFTLKNAFIAACWRTPS